MRALVVVSCCETDWSGCFVATVISEKQLLFEYKKIEGSKEVLL